MQTSILTGAPDHSVPRKSGFSAPVTQSADGVDVAGEAQLPRLSSARANNSASFGSFPAVSRISRLRMQPIAARRAGKPSPWHDQPPYGSHMPTYACPLPLIYQDYFARAGLIAHRQEAICG
jgi:hypothetical protein